MHSPYAITLHSARGAPAVVERTVRKRPLAVPPGRYTVTITPASSSTPEATTAF